MKFLEYNTLLNEHALCYFWNIPFVDSKILEHSNTMLSAINRPVQ